MSALFVDGAEIAEAQLLASAPSSGSSPSECHGCAWSRDGNYFAWSSGGRSVKLVKWDRQQAEWYVLFLFEKKNET